MQPVHKTQWFGYAVVVCLFGVAANLVAGPGPIAGPIVDPANGYSYYLLQNSDWTDAQAQAADLGGNLVTINNAAENAWICQTFTNFGGVERNLWIGLNASGLDGGVASNYSWIDGSTSTYRNWAALQPDLSSEQYAYIIPEAGGQWNNAQNNTEYGWEFNPQLPNFGVAEVIPEPNTYLLVLLGSLLLFRKGFSSLHKPASRGL